MTEHDHPSRRASDVQIPVLAAKVGQVEATLEAQQRWMSDLDRKVDEGIKDIRHELGGKLDKLTESLGDRTRMPMLPFIGILLTGAAVLIALGSQSIRAVNEHQRQALQAQTAVSEQRFAHLFDLFETHEGIGTRHKQEFRDHIRDGHSESVRSLMEEKLSGINSKIDTLDAQHVSENIEQEDDIEALRASDLRNEARNDAQEGRLTALESAAEHLPKFFQFQIDSLSKLLELKAQDRWTAGQQAIYAESEDQRHASLREVLDARITPLEKRIVGNTAAGFHRKDWEQVAVPRFKILEQRLNRLEKMSYAVQTQQ